MPENEKYRLVTQASGLAKWLKLTFTLSIFDHELIHWEYPPQSESK